MINNGNNFKVKNNKRIPIIILMVFSIILISVSCGYIVLDNLMNEGESGKLTDDIITTAPENNKKTMNILVVGIDYEKEESNEDDDDADDSKKSKGIGLTDVIMYVSCDIEKKTMSMLQIPRDSYVGEEVSTGGTGKINAVYSHGDDKTNRVSNLAKVINDQFGLPVDNYVAVDMEALHKIVSILGGLDMYVPWDVTDPEGNTISQGNHFMDADHIEWILRQRKGYGQQDLKRLELQQYFYSAVFDTFLTFPMSDIVKISPALIQYINTDLKLSDMIWLFDWMQGVDTAGIGVGRCPGGALGVVGGHTGLYGINADAIAPFLNEHFRPYGEELLVDELNLPKDLTFPSGEIEATIEFMNKLNEETVESQQTSENQE